MKVKKTTLEDAGVILRAARDRELLDVEDTLVIFVNLAVLADRVKRLKRSFPPGTQHAVAIKTNPLRFVLKYLVSLGVGLEAASLAEVMMARAAGAAMEEIVFDSPAKTAQEIALLQKSFAGARVNADSLPELARYTPNRKHLALGLRVNPLIPADSDSMMCVSGIDSKFGEPITNRQAILDAFDSEAALDCLHVHVGSQYKDLNPTVRAIREVVDLANEINETLGRRKVVTIDIGGGFPVNYRAGEPFLLEDYAARLAESVPELFDGSYRVITEFGRYVHANAAFAMTSIEYVKTTPRGITAITHAGADVFVRECYNPAAWYHEIGVFQKETGRLKHGSDTVATDVAGPLCFGGDFVARDRSLPRVAAGDELVIMDVGASTFALFSRHCSRPFPKIVAYDSDQGLASLHVAKPRESLESVARFWA